MANETIGRKAIGWLTISLCFFVLTVPLLFTSGGYVWDQDEYHIPAILQIRAHWPSIDLNRDALSAVAPGYHWFLAGVSFLVGTNPLVLRSVNLAVSFVVLVVLYHWMRAHLGPMDRAILLAPLATSNYFVKSSAWVITDNASLLLVTIVLIGLLGSPTKRSISLLGLEAAGATFVRQINAWLVGPLLYRWYQGDQDRTTSKGWIQQLVALASALSSFAVLAWLYTSWKGLVPPVWQEAAFKYSFAGVAYLTVIFFMFSTFIIGPRTLYLEARRLSKIGISAALGFGLLVASAGPTTYSYVDGRWGGYLWAIVEMFPSISDRSVFFFLISPLGTLATFAVWNRLRSRADSEVANLWLIAIISWSVTFLVNRQTFHRYFEPTALVFLTVAAAATSNGVLGRVPRFRLVSLAMIQTAGTIVSAWGKAF